MVMNISYNIYFESSIATTVHTRFNKMLLNICVIQIVDHSFTRLSMPKLLAD